MRGLGVRAADNIEVALRTLLDASPEVKVLLVTVPDIRDLPEFRDPLRDGKLDRTLADSVVDGPGTGPGSLAAAELARVDAEIAELLHEVVARFLAVLELYKEGAVSFDQVEPFGDLYITWTGTADGDITIGDDYGSGKPAGEGGAPERADATS